MQYILYIGIYIRYRRDIKRFIKEKGYLAAGDTMKDMSKNAVRRGYKPLKPIKPFKRWYICPHCGTYHESAYHDERGRSQCPHCGTWAYACTSREGKLYEAIFEKAKKKYMYDIAAKVAEKVLEELL